VDTRTNSYPWDWEYRFFNRLTADPFDNATDNYDQPAHQGCRFRAVKAVQGDHDPGYDGEDAFFSLDIRVLGPSLNKGHAFPGNIL
jgi:hypothetical protein